MKPLSGPHQKFCEGIVSGLNQTEAYRAAYPNASEKAAESSASALVRNPKIESEITRLREAAEKAAGGVVLTLAEKRKFLARLVRANTATLEPDDDGDLLNGVDYEDKPGGRRIVKLRIADKLAAIKLDNDLAGEGSEAKSNDALAGLMGRLRSKAPGNHIPDAGSMIAEGEAARGVNDQVDLPPKKGVDSTSDVTGG